MHLHVTMDDLLGSGMEPTVLKGIRLELEVRDQRLYLVISVGGDVQVGRQVLELLLLLVLIVVEPGFL